jgi:hypothetical protein
VGAEATAIPEAEHAPPESATARTPGGRYGEVLSLQRRAGNRGTIAALGATAKPAVLARCAGGACHCGGACGGHAHEDEEDLELERRGAALLRQTVAARTLARCAGGTCHCGGVCGGHADLAEEEEPQTAPRPRVVARQAAPKVCGPDITTRLRDTLRQVQIDFASWTADQKEEACDRILIPLRLYPEADEPPPQTITDLVRSFADINGWDIHALFQGESMWLRTPPVCGSCAQPTSSVPPDPHDNFNDAHEDPRTCSNTVAVAGNCWLNGTANYGLFGIMLRLCSDNGSWGALWRGEQLIKTYKSMGAHPEDPTHPLNWVRATYHGGPTGTPVGSGNRPSCGTTCSVAAPGAPAVNWDYVWEPVHPRSRTPPAARPPDTRDPGATV